MYSPINPPASVPISAAPKEKHPERRIEPSLPFLAGADLPDRRQIDIDNGVRRIDQSLLQEQNDHGDNGYRRCEHNHPCPNAITIVISTIVR